MCLFLSREQGLGLFVLSELCRVNFKVQNTNKLPTAFCCFWLVPQSKLHGFLIMNANSNIFWRVSFMMFLYWKNAKLTTVRKMRSGSHVLKWANTFSCVLPFFSESYRRIWYFPSKSLFNYASWVKLSHGVEKALSQCSCYINLDCARIWLPNQYTKFSKYKEHLLFSLHNSC